MHPAIVEQFIIFILNTDTHCQTPTSEWKGAGCPPAKKGTPCLKRGILSVGNIVLMTFATFFKQKGHRSYAQVL